MTDCRIVNCRHNQAITKHGIAQEAPLQSVRSAPWGVCSNSTAESALANLAVIRAEARTVWAEAEQTSSAERAPVGPPAWVAS